MDTHVVIMAGGTGSRLWPLSTPERPKQFIDLLGVGKSMLRLTADRFRPLCPPDRFWVVTSEEYVEEVRRQLPEIPESQILAEPEPRNTAPCIAYACRKIALRFPEAVVAVTPADAAVLNQEKFISLMGKALDFAAGTEHIVTIGIRPARPETGYGYICAASVEEEKIVKVTAFKEKPDRETAQAYLEAGNYFWNAGIFVWSVATINRQFSAHAPQICGLMDRMAPFFYTDREREAVREYFPRCERISIDYAIMEKSEDIYVIAGDLGWNDLGSWSAVGTCLPAGEEGNAAVGGEVRFFECSHCLVHAADARKVVVQGLDGYVVAVRDGNVLVCRLSESQRIREFAAPEKVQEK